MASSSSSSAPPFPLLTPSQPHTMPPTLSRPTTAPSSLSPTLPSTSSTRTSPSIPSSLSPSLPHSAETTRQIAEARAFLEASMTNIGSSLDRNLKDRAQNLHDNSKQLEKQQKDVVKATEGLKRENDKLARELREGSRRVKELGNVQNWAEMLERDFLLLKETLRLVREGSESNSEWETSSEGSYSESDVEGEENNQPGGSRVRKGDEIDGNGNGDGNGIDETGNGKSMAVEEQENTKNTDGDSDSKGKEGKAHEDGNGIVDADGDMRMLDTQHEVRHEDESKSADVNKVIVEQEQQMDDAINGHPVQDEVLGAGDTTEATTNGHANQWHDEGKAADVNVVVEQDQRMDDVMIGYTGQDEVIGAGETIEATTNGHASQRHDDESETADVGILVEHEQQIDDARNGHTGQDKVTGAGETIEATTNIHTDHVEDVSEDTEIKGVVQQEETKFGLQVEQNSIVDGQALEVKEEPAATDDENTTVTNSSSALTESSTGN